MTKDEAKEILEDVLDTLVEVGNGTTDEMLHDAANKLFRFRDEYFNEVNRRNENASKKVLSEV